MTMTKTIYVIMSIRFRPEWKKVQDLFAVSHKIDDDNVKNSGDKRLTVLKRGGSVGIGGEVMRRMRATAVALG